MTRRGPARRPARSAAAARAPPAVCCRGSRFPPRGTHSAPRDAAPSSTAAAPASPSRAPPRFACNVKKKKKIREFAFYTRDKGQRNHAATKGKLHLPKHTQSLNLDWIQTGGELVFESNLFPSLRRWCSLNLDWIQTGGLSSTRRTRIFVTPLFFANKIRKQHYTRSCFNVHF